MRFVYLLQAGKRNFSPHIHTTWEAFFRGSLYKSELAFRRTSRKNSPRMSASLNEAAMAGKLEEVAMRLNLGEDINQKLWPRFSAPLHDATICGRTEVAKLLIER